MEHRTSKIWLMYMSMVKILQQDIPYRELKYERIQSLHEILPYLAASGHNNYVKSLVLYLGDMVRPSDIHPDEFDKFRSVYFASQ